MATIIQHVGFSIDSPEEQLARLFDMLARYTLDPMFEPYGDFVYAAEPDVLAAYERAHGATFDAPRTVHVWGNFFDYSCVFSLYTDDAALIERVRAAVKANKRKAAYKRAKEERAEQRAYWKRHEEETRRRLSR